MFARQPAAVFLRNIRAVGDAQKRVVRLVHVGLSEMHVVGGDERQIFGVGQFDDRLFRGPFFGQTVPLQFDIEPVAEDGFQPVQQFSGG